MGYWAASSPSRRDVLSTLAAAGASTLIDPGRALARLAANQPCAGPDAPGTLLGTLPLFRSGAPEQPSGVKLGGPGLDARLVTDLSTLAPDRLITPNRLAFIRTESPPAAAHHDPWTIRASGLIADSRTLTIDDLTAPRAQHGTAPARVLRQQQSGQFRPDERVRLGRSAALRRGLATSPIGRSHQRARRRDGS